MKVDLSKVITGISKVAVQSDGEPLTIKKALLMTLSLPSSDPKGSSPEEALKSRKLFDRIDDAENEIDLKSDEVVKLKRLVAEKLSELVAGSVILALEPE